MLSSEQCQLVEDNYYLIYWFLKKHQLSIDEYYDVAAIGLCKAAKLYDSQRGFKFATFAYAVMLNEFRMTKRKTEKSVVPYIHLEDTPISAQDATYANIIADEADYFESIESVLCVQTAMKKLNTKLSERDMKILGLYLNDMKQVEIAKRFGITQAQVSRIIARARKIAKGLYNGL